MLKYIHRIPNKDNGEQPELTYIYEENKLKHIPSPALFENTVQYEESESRHLSSFECSFARCESGYIFDNRREERFSVFYVSRGCFWYNGSKMSVGDSVFIEPYFDHTLICGDSESEIYRISWSGDITVHIAQMLRNFTSDNIYRVGFIESIPSLIDQVIYNKYLDKINVKQLAVGFTDMMLAFLTRATHPDSSDKKPADLISRAKNVIETNYADLKVEQLANILYINSKYLSKMFRKHTGMTPKQYITETKMTHAEHYLVSTEYPIQKVSEIVGYNNYTNFYIAFKSKYGTPPEEYRRMFADHDAAHKIK